MADDLGWRDLGCYGSSFYETPALDQLARDGTRFMDAYASCPVCSPTRASFMTGKYPASIGITDWIDFWGETHPAKGHLVDAPYEKHLPHDETTIAEVLSANGYATFHVGKWHLGGAGDDSLPTDHGFDINIAGCELGVPDNGYFAPWEIPTLAEDPQDSGRYLPNRLGEEAVSLIESHQDQAMDKPFFLNYNPYLVHTPLQAPDDAVARYEEKRSALGLADRDELEVGGRFPTKHKKDSRIKRRLVQSHPTYAAMVESLDRNVGRVLDTLDRVGCRENTIVIFTSDNGGLATSEGSPTTNRPLREGKGWMMEGGNRVPLIIQWPGITDREETPAVSRTPVTTPDLYPTVLDGAGIDTPAEQTVEGVSIRPSLKGTDLDRKAIYWHYPHYGNQGGTPSAAIRTTQWKLIEFFETGTVELYQVADDIGETQDLSDHRPEVRDELHEQLTEWQETVDAQFPSENPEYTEWPDRAGAPD